MTKNTHGYVTELEYTAHYYDFQNPVLINYVAGLNGLGSLDNLENFSYCELGCGKGATLNVLADANPDSRFVGIDINQTHIEQAQQLAEHCGINNVEYHAASFEDWQTLDMPEFDYISLHGVYSWISPELQAHIIDLIGQKLKPGGLVMVSYNALPGKSLDKILRDMMLTYTRNMDVSLLEKTSHGISYLNYLAEKQVPFFQKNPQAASKVENLKKQDMRYIAHEYYNEFWQPMYFEEVCRHMQRAGLQFAGQTDVLLNYADLAFPQNVRHDFDQAPDRISLEIHRAFIMNEEFRRDIYIKPGETTSLSLQEVAERFAYVLTVPPEKFAYQIETPAGLMSLEGKLFKPLVEALSGSVKTIEQLAQLDTLADFPKTELIDAINKLLIGGQVKLCKPAARAEKLSRLNQLIWEQAQGLDNQTFSSVVLGGGMMLSGLDIVMLKACQQDDDQAVEEVLAQLAQAQKTLLDEKGQPIKDPEALQKAVKQQIQYSKEQVYPLLKQLGIIA